MSRPTDYFTAGSEQAKLRSNAQKKAFQDNRVKGIQTKNNFNKRAVEDYEKILNYYWEKIGLNVGRTKFYLWLKNNWENILQDLKDNDIEEKNRSGKSNCNADKSHQLSAPTQCLSHSTLLYLALKA